MVKMYFNNQETKEERSLSRFDLQEGKERRTRVLNAQRAERETDSDMSYDSPEEEDKGILVQSCDDGEPRTMRKDTDIDLGRDSELVGNHRRGHMTSGPRRKATPKAKRLSEGNLCTLFRKPAAVPLCAGIGLAGEEVDSDLPT